MLLTRLVLLCFPFYKLQAKEDAGNISSREKRQLSIAESKSETFVKINESIDTKLGNLANCENLIQIRIFI